MARLLVAVLLGATLGVCRAVSVIGSARGGQEATDAAAGALGKLPLKPPLFSAIDSHCSLWHIRCGTRWHVLPFDGFTNCVGDLLAFVGGACAAE